MTQQRGHDPRSSAHDEFKRAWDKSEAPAEYLDEPPEKKPDEADPVEEASDASFPASDPPSYTPNTSIGPPEAPEEKKD